MQERMLPIVENAASGLTRRALERARKMFLAEAERAQLGRRWHEENADAIQASNAWIEKHGLPMEKHRLF